MRVSDKALDELVEGSGLICVQCGTSSHYAARKRKSGSGHFQLSIIGSKRELYFWLRGYFAALDGVRVERAYAQMACAELVKLTSIADHELDVDFTTLTRASDLAKKALAERKEDEG